MSFISIRSAVIAMFCGAIVITAVAVHDKAPDKEPAASAKSSDALGDDFTQPTATRSISPKPLTPELFKQSITREGIAVEFSIHRLDPAGQELEKVHESDDVRICFRVTDTATGKPVRGGKAVAWMDFISKDSSRIVRTSEQKAKAFLEGNMFNRPEVDLNVFNVLTLNNEANISVVAPLFGFGGTKLLNMILLESPGEDWIINTTETRVYVTMPTSQKVAVIDPATAEVVKNIELGRRPGRIVLQPDESRVWVADQEGNADKAEVSGFTLIDTNKLTLVTRLTTGRGHHEMAFSDDGRRAFATNEQDGTVSVIDTRSLKTIAALPTSSGPASVSFSPLAKMAYIAVGDEVIVIDGTRAEVVTRIKAEPGLGQIRFAPGGRLGFVVNPSKNLVHIIDAATNRVIQSAGTEREPFQVTFTSEFAYVRHRGSETVLMLPLKALVAEKRRVQVFSFPGGRIPPGNAPQLSPADGIVPAPGEGAVLVANPMDRSVYFYKEGMAAPSGTFSNYGRQPRALLVVDRSLRERGFPGIYETLARIRCPGEYDVVFLLESPRIVHSFSVSVQANAALEEKRNSGKLNVEHLVKVTRAYVGETAKLRFRLTDRQSREPVVGLTDVEVLTNLMPGVWHKRHMALAEGDGVYSLDFAPPRSGLYYVYLQCSSRGLGFNNDQYLVLNAVEKDESHEKNR